jgi:hypothetical protein
MKTIRQEMWGRHAAGRVRSPRRSSRVGALLQFGEGLFFLLMFLAPALGASPVVTTNSAGSLLLTNNFGDLNDDGQVDVRDIVLLTHHLNGTRLLSTQMLARAEVNLDGAVSDTDRRILAEMIAGRNTGPNDDFDNDELANAEEIRRGTNPFDPDTDHDGWLDGWEVTEGTDPLNPLSRIPMTIVTRASVRVIFPKADTSSAESGGVTIARPPIQVVFPAFRESEQVGAVTVAHPSVRVILPPVQDSNTNTLGPVVAHPPISINFPAP